MKSLDEEIDHIESLDELRLRARELRDEALDVLNNRPYTPRPRRPGASPVTTSGEPGWQAPGDDVEKALMLRALRMPRGETGKETRTKLLADLGSITLEDCETSEAPTAPNTSYEHIPILRSALVMQALVETPGHALSDATLACFYRIVQELYVAVPPTWTVGAARAGSEALPSAFVTGECARAVLALDRALRAAADAVDMLGRAAGRIGTSPRPVQRWSEQDELFRSQSLSVSLNALRPWLPFELPESLETAKPAELLVRMIGSFKSSPLVTRVRSANTADSALLEASHAIAIAAVNGLRDSIEKVARQASGGTTEPARIGKDVAETLRTAAQQVRRLLHPVEGYTSSVIDRELAAASSKLDHEPDGVELVFAAATFGRLCYPDRPGEWDHPKTRAAIDLALRLLTEGGRLPSVRPFDVLTKGYRLHVAGLEGTRRLAELVANVDLQPEPEFVRRLMRPFHDTRAFSRDGKPAGWTADTPRPERESEWWATALAADALDQVVRMLDAGIDRHVLRHFSVRRPSELSLRLDDLFYPDFGLASVKTSSGKAPESVAVKLQRLRAHVSGVPQPKGSAYSLILYGPPGTGKTTLAEALAKSANVPLVEITPSDILIGGEEAVERRARLVFAALSMLTDAVIIFDEFDPILQERTRTSDPLAVPRTVFEFLTPGMLPKLKKLHDAAKAQRVAYILATNFIYKLDEAATREGRFDEKHGIYPPDVVSRLGRLLDQYRQWPGRTGGGGSDTPDRQRVITALKMTAGGPIGLLAKPEWFRTPAEGVKSAGAVFGHLRDGTPFGAVPREATFDTDWRTDEKKPKKPGPFWQKYWEDWQTVETWEGRLDASDGPADDVSWDMLVEQWTKP